MKKLLTLSLILMGTAFAFSPETLETMKGEKMTTKADIDTTFVMFWASWCGTCKYKLQKTLPNVIKEIAVNKKKINVMTVNFGKNLRREKHYIKKNKIKDVPVYRVVKGTADEKNIVKQNKVTNAPHWAVFKKKSGKWNLIDAKEGFQKADIEKALGTSLKSLQI